MAEYGYSIADDAEQLRALLALPGCRRQQAPAARSPPTHETASLIAAAGADAGLRAAGRLDRAVGDRRSQADNFSVLIAILANFIVYTDAVDLLLRLYARRRQTWRQRPPSCRSIWRRPRPRRHIAWSLRAPYAIIASIFNLDSRGQLDDFMEALGPYRDRVWLISDGSTDQTVARLRQAGWRCFEETGQSAQARAHCGGCSSDCRATLRPSW